MKIWYAGALVVASLVAFAVPAHADEDLYLQVLSKQSSYNYNKYGSAALLKEGYKVCDAVSQGYDFASVLSMIQSDLAVSAVGAGAIYGAATAGLGC
jgi:hypothetical protein